MTETETLAPAKQPDTSTIDARVVKALGHPTRVRILGVLRSRELVSPVELAGELGVPLGTVGYHVRRLEALGFIELAKRTQRRGAVEHHYRVRPALDQPLKATPPPKERNGARKHPGTAAAAVVQEAREAVPRGGFDAVAARCDRRTVALDARGRTELTSALEEWLAAIERIEQDSAKRLAADGADASPHACTAVLMLFDAADGRAGDDVS
jgi:DNA-binding transcriptional ArsR family regulator